MHMTKTTLILAGLLAAVPMTVAAAQQRSFAGCWLRPAPAPTCGGFIVTEAAVEIPLTSTKFNISAGSTEKDFDTRFVLSAGYMHNLDNGRGVVWPAKYLKSWRGSGQKSPVTEVKNWKSANNCKA